MKRDDSKSSVQSQWLTWLIDNLVHGVDPEQLVSALSNRNVTETTARQWIERAQGSNGYAELMRHTRPIRQRHQYLGLRRHLDGLRAEPTAIRSLTHLDAADFFEDYYFENRPVVIRGYANQWPARQKWTPDFIKDQYGDVEVNITDDRLSNPNYDMQHKRHTRTCTLGAFVDRVVANDSGNNAYMVANNRAIEHPEFAPIINDIDYDPEMFDASRWKGCSAFWLGPELSLIHI